MRMSTHEPGPEPSFGEQSGWREEPAWAEPNQVHLTRIDVPFLELTWFFIKASLAMALAFSVTSWLWVMIGTGIGSLLAGLLFLLGVPKLLTEPALAPPSAIVAPASEPLPAVERAALPSSGTTEGDAPEDDAPEGDAPEGSASEVRDEAPAPRAAPRNPDRDATEALQREEIERMRRDRR